MNELDLNKYDESTLIYLFPRLLVLMVWDVIFECVVVSPKSYS